MVPGLTFRIAEPVDVRVAVSAAVGSALLADAAEVDRSLVGTIVSELGMNIVKYGERGRVTLARVEEGATVHIDITADDEGPGIADLDLALQDHYTTGGSLGLGLPGVRRMSDTFRVEAIHPRGTRVAVRKRIRGPATHRSAGPPVPMAPEGRSGRSAGILSVGSHVRPMVGEVVSGDVAAVVPIGPGTLVMLADVTGHGPRAAAVAEGLPTLLAGIASTDLRRVLTELHRALLGGPGAAIGLLWLDPEAAEFSYVAVGNTGATRLDGALWRGVSRDGVVGIRLPTLYEQRGALRPGDRFVCWTDGVSEQGMRRSPVAAEAAEAARGIIAAHGRSHDDAGVVVVEWPR